MSLSKKILVTLSFLAVLLLLAGADVTLTRGTLWIPERNGADAGVGKQTGPDVLAIVRAHGFTLSDTHEDFLMQSVLPAGSTVNSGVLLQNNDRVAAMAWMDSPDVQRTFTLIKERLRASFSPGLKDLIDETQSERGKPPRDILSFRDPAIATDRLVFARVRQRLFEFHVREGKEATIDGLVDALTE